MKKLISISIVLVMLAAAVTAALPVGAVIGEVDEVDALYFDVKPTIDGIVTEAEWGEISAVVDKNEAATIEDTSPVNNRFFMRNTAAVPGFDQDVYTMYYELWIRWDENYYYVAARVEDLDGHSLKNGRNETWNGDALQFRVDPRGYNASSPRGAAFYDAEKDGKPWSKDDVPDFCVGFVEIAGGFSEAWSNSPGTSGIGITPYLGGGAQVSVSPAGAQFSSDTQSGVTTYEIAIPWSLIDARGNKYEKYAKTNESGGIGKKYGMSAVVYNADGTSGQNTWNAVLAWGSGIVNTQQTDYTKTCAGSNKIVLSGDKVSEDPNYSKDYPWSDPYIPSTPPPKYPLEIDESVHVGPITYDSESDMALYGDFIDGERVKDSDGNWVVRWDEDFGGTSLSPTKSGLNETNYLATDGPDGKSAYESPGCSYTMEFDIKVTGTETFEDGYPAMLYNWFGGNPTVDYECGYNFDTGKFSIKESKVGGKVLEEKNAEFTLGKWHHWVFQYFKDNSEIRFYFDPEMENGRVSKDAEPIFKRKWRYFDSPGLEKTILIFRRFNCQIMMDNVQFYNFVNFTEIEIPETESVDTGETVPPTPVDEIGDVDFKVTKRDDGTFALSIPNEEKYSGATVTAVKFTVDLTKTEGKLTFKGVEGLAEDAYTATDNGDGTVTIRISDLKTFSNVGKDRDVFYVILSPAAGADLTAEQVKEKVSIRSTVTTLAAQTGDMEVFYICAFVLMLALLGTGITVFVYSIRREYF